jgi:hypothetical protein
MAALHPEDHAASPMKTTEELKALRESITRGMWSTDTLVYDNFPVHAVRAEFYTDAVHYRKPRAGHTKAERIRHNADSQAIALVPYLLSEVIRLREELERMVKAATDVVNRWESPQWKWDEHTGVFIHALRDSMITPNTPDNG